MKILLEVEGEREEVIQALAAAGAEVSLVIEDPKPPRGIRNSLGVVMDNPALDRLEQSPWRESTR